MDDTITGFIHLDKIADEIGDEAGTCDADYAFQRAAAQMIYDLRNALEQAEARAERAESAQLALCQTLSDIAVELGCACDNEVMLLVVHELKTRAEADAESVVKG